MNHFQRFRNKAEAEIYCLLCQICGTNRIEYEPKTNGKYADFLIKPNNIYIEVYTIVDLYKQREILEKKGWSKPRPVTVIFEKAEEHEQVLHRILDKILNELKHFNKNDKNVLIVKVAMSEEYGIFPRDVIDVFKESVLIVNAMGTKVGHIDHLRSEEEQEQISKLSALIAYRRVCSHKKLDGEAQIWLNDHAKVPLSKKDIDILNQMVCDKCRA